LDGLPDQNRIKPLEIKTRIECPQNASKRPKTPVTATGRHRQPRASFSLNIRKAQTSFHEVVDMKIDVTKWAYSEIESEFANASRALSFNAEQGRVFVSMA